jgi:hypothetical protein
MNIPCPASRDVGIGLDVDSAISPPYAPRGINDSITSSSHKQLIIGAAYQDTVPTYQ